MLATLYLRLSIPSKSGPLQTLRNCIHLPFLGVSTLLNFIRPFYASGFLLRLVTLTFPNWQENWPLTISVSLGSHLIAGLLCLLLHAATVIIHNLMVCSQFPNFYSCTHVSY
ncbi:hypothetical protein EDB86DRAFT_2947943, partial [Lactarius hatsudake]